MFGASGFVEHFKIQCGNVVCSRGRERSELTKRFCSTSFENDNDTITRILIKKGCNTCMSVCMYVVDKYMTVSWCTRICSVIHLS